MIRDTLTFRNELNQAIDFQNVLEQIASFASFSCSKEDIKNALPESNYLLVQMLLKECNEAMEFENSGALLDFAGCTDIRETVSRADKKMILNGRELCDIANFLSACYRVSKAFDAKYETLYDLAHSIDPCSKIMKQIFAQIDLTGSIKNDATSLLKRKNDELIETRLSIQSKGRNFVKKHSAQLMETMTTSISGRLCVLVKAQDKNRLGGMVHGQSQSGLAFYVEPNEFIELNNRIQLIENEIEEEKKRICQALTNLVSKSSNTILSNLETMTRIDVALTKARWATHNDGCIPTFYTKDSRLYFENARHPLIDSKKVVANTYELKSNQYCLMISGPNMGGKTVTLKTIGLFVALSHAGFPVMCHHAHLPFFESMWFDIGDNQSIENNLSTFSSHISKVSQICEHANQHTFVLLDELGNGTDPLEGASLAIAVIEFLIQKQTKVITSTHYNQVKSFGKTNSHVLVSSVEFDSQTLKPTYKYISGVSGASYAFSIAKQYHLDPSIVDRANQLKDENTLDVDVQLERLEKMQTEVRKEKERFDILIKDAHRIQKEANELKDKVEQERIDLEENYQDELDRLLEEKEQQAQSIIKKLRSENVGKMHEQIESLHQIRDLSDAPKKEQVQEKEQFQVGDYVQINGLNSHGEIVDIRRSEATVDVNGMKTKIKLNRLSKMTKPGSNKVKVKQRVNRTFTRFPLELNVIGMHVDEALDALDHYLDQAVVHRVKQVRIVHGMGTGALRNAIWKDLDKHPSVKEKTSAGPSDGGLGATIVLLK